MTRQQKIPRAVYFFCISVWLGLVNLLVEIIALEGRIKYDFIYFELSAVAFVIHFLADLTLVITSIEIESVSRKILLPLVGIVFLVKSALLLAILVIDLHVISTHWILTPYNSQ